MDHGRRAKKPANGAAKTAPWFNAQAFLESLKVNSSLLSVVLHD